MGTAWYWTTTSPADLAPWLLCSWQAEPHGPTRLTPDGCSDLVCTSTGLVLLCGPEQRSWQFELPEGTTAVGVRFRAGQVRALFDIDVSTIMDRQVRLHSVIGSAADDLVPFCSPAEPLEARRASLLGWCRRWTSGRQPDPLSERIVAMLDDELSMTQQMLAERLALSCRTLHRRTSERFGYGIATLTRLMRFQRMIALSLSSASPATLSELAATAGYADHSHLVRDCRQISDDPPSVFLAEHFPTFPDLADPYKTTRSPFATIGE